AVELPAVPHPEALARWRRGATSANAGWPAAAPGCPGAAGSVAWHLPAAAGVPGYPGRPAPSPPGPDWCATPAIATTHHAAGELRQRCPAGLPAAARLSAATVDPPRRALPVPARRRRLATQSAGCDCRVAAAGDRLPG